MADLRGRAVGSILSSKTVRRRCLDCTPSTRQRRLPFRYQDNTKEVLSLLRKYASVPMSLADACLVRMSETMSTPLSSPRIPTYASTADIAARRFLPDARLSPFAHPLAGNFVILPSARPISVLMTAPSPTSAAQDKSRRARPARISFSTRTTRSTGGPGGRRRSRRPSAPTSRSCCRSVTRPATGAT